MLTNVIANQDKRNELAASLGDPQDSQGRRSSRQTPLPAPVEARARHRLQEDCPYAHYFKCVSFEFENGVLTLHGRVPTYHLKQILQSWLRNLEGVVQIDNQVAVVSATGLSSDPGAKSSR